MFCYRFLFFFGIEVSNLQSETYSCKHSGYQTQLSLDHFNNLNKISLRIKRLYSSQATLQSSCGERSSSEINPRFVSVFTGGEGCFFMLYYYRYISNNIVSMIKYSFLNFSKNLLNSYNCTHKFIGFHLKYILCFIAASFSVLACGNLELLMVNFYFFTLILPMFQLLIIYYYRPNLVIDLLVGRLTLGACLIFF